MVDAISRLGMKCVWEAILRCQGQTKRQRTFTDMTNVQLDHPHSRRDLCSFF